MMVTRKSSSTKLQQKHRRIVKEIEKKFGRVIDLDRSPFVLVEIIREFGHQFDEENGGGGEGGVSPSSIAVAGPPDPPEDPPAPDAPDDPELPQGMVTKLLLTMQKDIKALNRKIDQLATRTK
jgi:hypothetical protein